MIPEQNDQPAELVLSAEGDHAEDEERKVKEAEAVDEDDNRNIVIGGNDIDKDSGASGDDDVAAAVNEEEIDDYYNFYYGNREIVVRFSEEANETYEIPRMIHFEENLDKVIWYCADDYADMAEENADVVTHILDSECPETTSTQINNAGEATTRGLEYMIPNERDRRLKRREEAIDVVLDEQHQQRYENIINEEWIAGAYIDVSERAMDEARSIGLADEREAVRIKGIDSCDDSVSSAESSEEGRTKGEAEQVNYWRWPTKEELELEKSQSGDDVTESVTDEVIDESDSPSSSINAANDSRSLDDQELDASSRHYREGLVHRPKEEEGSNDEASFEAEYTHSVDFDPEVSVMEIIHIDDYTKDEVRNSWYSRSFIKDGKKRVKDFSSVYKTLKERPQDDSAMKSMSYIVARRYCKEGKRNIMLGLNAVMDEQLKKSSAQKIAKAYAKTSRKCCEKAHKIALDDARFAKAYLEETVDEEAPKPRKTFRERRPRREEDDVPSTPHPGSNGKKSNRRSHFKDFRRDSMGFARTNFRKSFALGMNDSVVFTKAQLASLECDLDLESKSSSSSASGNTNKNSTQGCKENATARLTRSLTPQHDEHVAESTFDPPKRRKSLKRTIKEATYNLLRFCYGNVAD